MIRTRFAPSPTGYLHIGGLRTALYAYLYAKKHGGQFLLRIEDTDRERFVEDGVKNILNSLVWAGLVPDEGVVLKKSADNVILSGHPKGTPSGKDLLSPESQKDSSAAPQNDNCVAQVGKRGPYIQSERLEIYQKYAQELLDRGHAYYCFCSSERLMELREKQQKNKIPTGYDGLCAGIDPQEAKKRIAGGEKHVIRMKMPKFGETVFNDLIRGEIRIKNELVDDQVIIKSDGFPTYHLAVVVDDHLMGITVASRGEEWISSTPKHLQLYKYFGWQPPEFAHLPLLLNFDKSKLSKRQGDVAVEDYIKKGYLPEAVINFVAFLGWNPGDNRELFTLEDLIKEFDFAKVNKSGAVFNLEKLDWFNKEYIKRLPLENLVERVVPFFKTSKLTINNEQLTKALPLERERVATLAELPKALAFVFELPEYDSSLLVWKKSNMETVTKVLPGLEELLNTFSVQSWNKSDLEIKIGEWIKENNYNNGEILWPLRVALSGQDKSPGPFEIAEVLKKDETINRIKIAIKKLIS
ncbi:MAG: glutamate--tRNA ligase [Candidatus Magasanikbacteria bacterium]